MENATVKILALGGQGVLIPGAMILTAGHCIDYKVTGAMVLGDYFIEEIHTQRGAIKASVFAVEPCADAAILGSPDDQEMTEEAERFKEFCEATKAIRLCTADFPLFEVVPIHLLTHHGEWMTGEARQCQEQAKALAIRFDRQIETGTSGGPIVNDAGELVAILSNCCANGLSVDNAQPRPHLALPVWAVRRIESCQRATPA